MTETSNAGHEQARLWNGAAGRAWTDTQDLLDRVFRPIEQLLVDAAAARPRRHVLDVGCGTGATTRAVARRLGRAVDCTGIDISEPMIAAARDSAAREGSPARFICADAQTHPFDAHQVDLIISRFGVMFFVDPVAALGNLRRGAAADAELTFVAWRAPAENPFMTTAERAAAPLLPNLPPRQADAPGQFAFADGDRVRRILDASGWAEIELRRVDVPCVFPASELTRYISRLGPVGLALENADEVTRERVIEVVGAAFEPFIARSKVQFTAACWMVHARAAAPRC